MTNWDALLTPALWRVTLYSFALLTVVLAVASLVLGRVVWPPRTPAVVAVAVLWCLGNVALVYAVHRAAYAMESHDTFCVSCHLHEAEFNRFHTERPAAAPDLAAFHQRQREPLTCISCHVGEGIFGRARVLTFAGLDVLRYASGQFQRELDGMRHPLNEDACRKCHAPSELGGFHKVPAHASHQGGCLVCHIVHARTDEAFGFIDYQRWPREVLEPCQGCHPALLQ